MERLIFHIDVNSAFLSWESARRVSQGLPDLREIPSCVGGDPKKRTEYTRCSGRNTGEMWPLPVRNLLFLGKASEQKLLNQGIRTIGDRGEGNGKQMYSSGLGRKPEHR